MPASVNITYSGAINVSDPKTDGVVVIGKQEHFDKLKEFPEILKPKFGSVIDSERLKEGIDQLTVNCSVELYFKNFTLACMPSKCSRHNAPMLPHSLSSLVKTHTQLTPKQYIVILCEQKSAFALGCAASRVFPLYNRKKEEKKENVDIVVEFVFVDNKDYSLTTEEVNCLVASAESIRLTAKIVDMPCNEMHTNAFLDEIRNVAKELSLEPPTIIQDLDLVKKGMGGLYGVGKAAVNKPALAVLSHKVDGATKNIAWCGKGIVYDTGGLSIKDKLGMVGMKRDCGGAAGILGAFRSAVKNGFSENLFAVLCLAENAVGPEAARPDDVHTMYSGLTVEINNTDAEGRLVLGDGVAYAKKDLNADVIVDMATLTGAQGISTGQYHAAILTNNEDMETCCVKAGKTSGDLVFPVPYTPEFHFDEFKSHIADMKNSVKNRGNAQVSCAGLFIGSHIGFDYEGVWLHVDMAAPVKKNELGTGYGVALLTTLFGKYSKNSMLSNIAPKIEI